MNQRLAWANPASWLHGLEVRGKSQWFAALLAVVNENGLKGKKNSQVLSQRRVRVKCIQIF